MTDIANLENSLGIKFNNSQLLAQALVHRSFLNESDEFKQSNERLEFLGDSVLQILTSKRLYEQFPAYAEGDLTNIRSILVRSTSLAEIGKELNLGAYLLMSKGEKESGGPKNSALLANTVEAIIGAMFLDSGLDIVQSFLDKYLFPKIEAVLEHREMYDYKSKIQEVTQDKFKISPSYRLISQVGPDHDKVFTVGLYIDKKLLGTGQGKSKQSAEQEAAKQALEKVEEKR